MKCSLSLTFSQKRIARRVGQADWTIARPTLEADTRPS